MYLYNSATHKKEEFKTHTPGRVEMYTCGPTVYHFAHIGNLRSYIMEDVLEKFLRWTGYDVHRVMNITDVGHLTSDADEGEDKMLKGAKREHKTVMEIAQFYTDAFFEDCRKLNIKRPDVCSPPRGSLMTTSASSPACWRKATPMWPAATCTSTPASWSGTTCSTTTTRRIWP